MDNSSCSCKVVVFDLDETLGYFTEFGLFLDCLRKENVTITQDIFNTLLDLYSEFLRPNIISILTFLKYQKLNKSCSKIMIYSNNKGPKVWAQMIIRYFENKINYSIFDDIICAFQKDGKPVEISRNKGMDDLMKCTKLPINTEVLFLDDSYHPEMVNPNVYYIHLLPYYHMLPFETMVDRFLSSNISKQVDININNMQKNWSKTDFIVLKKKIKEYNVEKIVSKQIMILLQKFFKNALNPERKKKVIVPAYSKSRRRNKKIRKQTRKDESYMDDNNVDS